MRRNADLFMSMTTTGFDSLDKVYKEYASLDYANQAHFIGAMLETTKEFGVFIVDNTDANKRGSERFLGYRAGDAADLPPFSLFCPAAWGVRTGAEKLNKAAEQRRQTPRTIKYERSTLVAYKNRDQTQVARDEVQGTTWRHEHAKDETETGLFAKLATRHSNSFHERRADF